MANARHYTIDASEDRKFTLANYHTGLLSNGQQVLLIPHAGKGYLLVFSPDGTLLETRNRPIQGWDQAESTEMRFQRRHAASEEWLDDLSVQDSPIRVRKFSIHDPIDVGIEDCDYYHDEYDPDDENDARDLRAFAERGIYKLHLPGTSKWLDGRGRPAG